MMIMLKKAFGKECLVNNINGYKMRINYLVVVVSCIFFVGCSSYKNVPYMQNPEVVNDFNEILPMYDAKIMPKDLLTITVNTTNPEAAAPFNLIVQSAINSARSNSLTQQPSLQQYLVNNEGYIDFPALGRLKVGGLTKNEAEDMIREKLASYLSEVPIVTVRMVNYKISVMGEVARPGTFTVSNEKVNVLEALAMAGDLTIWGIRDDVKLIRENSVGKREIISLNLNDASLITGPYYYLQQNDILYVTPNETKAKNSDVGQSTSLWFSATSILVSVVSLLYNILK